MRYYWAVLQRELDGASCYRRSSVVCLCVCLSVGRVRGPCKSRQNDRDADWMVNSGGPKEPCIRWWSRCPERRRHFFAVVQPIQKYWVIAAMYAAKKSITTSALLRQPTALFATGQCDIYFSPVKNPPPAMWPLANILWALVNLLNFLYGIIK